MKKIKHLPTILGLLLVLGAIASGVVLIKKGPTLFLKASPSLTPTQIKVTNITDSSFTVSWLTDEKTSGFIKHGPDNTLAFTAQDDRDQLSGKTGSFQTHHITVKDLKASTAYFFKIGSGNKIFDNSNQPYQITTAKTTQSPPPNDVAYGTVIDQNNNPVEGAIIYLSLANASPASTLTKSSGSWVIPLNLIRSADLNNWATYDKEASIEEIFVQASPLGTATVVATTKNDSPMPKITLSQNFDFRKTAEVKTEEEKIQMENQATASSKFSLPAATESSPSPTPTLATVSGQLKILNPDQGENVNTQKPEIIGTGPTGITLDIEIHSEATYSAKVKIDAKGNWTWSPPKNLEPGEHTITASYKDAKGILQKVTQKFIVLAAGDSDIPAITASSSAKATSSATPTPSKIATPSPTPTTASGSARKSMPSTESGVPTTGNLTPTFLVFIMGLSLIFLGLFLKIKKAF
jgi:hypothetical protein